jgi:excisionase family DNA binding protein
MTDLLSTEQAAQILQVTTGTLVVWRCTRRFPLKYVKVGRKVKYHASDLEEFLCARTVPGVVGQPKHEGSDPK